MKVSIVILSKTSTKEEFDVSSNCITSLMESEDLNKINFEIILVESNADYCKLGYKYPENVKIIVPDCKFNFHKFLNLGINMSSGDYIALCNNDIIFKKK